MVHLTSAIREFDLSYNQFSRKQCKRHFFGQTIQPLSPTIYDIQPSTEPKHLQNPTMAVRPITRSPFLLLTLSICIALPSLAISAHILSIFRSEHASNPWWLPIWHAHFNTHSLMATIATCCIIVAVDTITIGLVVAANKTGWKVNINCYSRSKKEGLTREPEQDNEVDESGIDGGSFSGSSHCYDHASCCEC